MRNSRLVVGLVAVACAVALPAAAAAHKDQPEKAQHAAKAAHGHPGKGKGGDPNSATVRLAPATGQTAKGVAELKQRTGALGVALVVSHLTPGAFYAAHVHAGTCAAPGAVALTLPDVYADEHGNARLVTTLPTAPTADYVANGFSVDVHAGPSASPGATISCGDVTVKAAKTYAKAWLKGTTAKGHAEAVQKGSDLTVWVNAHGLTPGAHAFSLLAANGVASAKIPATSSTPVLGTGFSFAIFTGPTAAPGAVVACGDQSAWWNHGHK